ncbi:hypothetical protein GOC91_04295 [Sinorhizobium medicae]|uniref:PilZ domain-containing protein n=3 Tax=Sinorhizobium medicae TaxID=110321 RepID=A0A508X686_9HYPH|nr:conserved hypothetical protein [Sinorhizobium medicae WSM419]MDX0406177.1 hypothetical protein [Sinorhizobium medicae]MDX0412945.1 hypothetical protein [Sinorhizobium medicae]MDX0417916.1 hypothetical protein [Sinorhizobium medicae]MDX0422331.1 hypothetical protein [Sinorhizobium medicae]
MQKASSMSSAAPGIIRHFLNREESFMYDREASYPLEDTRNEARIEFTEKGMQHLSSRRCEIIKISKSSALIGILTQFQLPENFYLDIPSARIPLIGCLLKRVHSNNIIEARFLRLLSDRDLNRIFVYSTHPNHRNRTLDIYR